MTGKIDTQPGGKRAELYVIGELLRRGIVPYVPVVDMSVVDALVRTASGRIVSLQIKSAGSAGGRDPRWFQVAEVTPRKDFFLVCVEFQDGQPSAAWVLPSVVFDQYATRPAKGTPRDLNLDIGTRKHGMPLADLLCGFRNRWELIVNYERYEALLDSPEALEDLLAMREAVEAPGEEVVTREEYELRRAVSALG